MKITYKQFREIMNYKKVHPLQALMGYRLEVKGNCAVVSPYIPLWLYILGFIPGHLVLALCLMWDGGLREFYLIPRNLAVWTFQYDERACEIAKKIYERA